MKPIFTLIAAALCSNMAAGADPPAPPAPGPEATARVRPARTDIPPARDVGVLVRDFNQARQSYLGRRGQLEKALQTANEQQRQALREQLQKLREEQLRARDELRQQLQQLRENLPNHQDLIDAARERTGSRPRRGGE